MDAYQSYKFGAFELHTRQRLLLRDGRAVALGGKTFALLAVLLEHAGVTLSAEVLMRLVWPGRVVDESNIRVHINRLRNTLDDGEQERSCIQTLPLRGYGYVGAVQAIMALPSNWACAEAGGDGGVAALPLPLTPLYGRDSDSAELGRLIPLKRLVTVVGPGGVGKTGLVLAVARATASRTLQRVVYVDLAPLGETAGRCGDGYVGDVGGSGDGKHGDGRDRVRAAIAAACGCPAAASAADLCGWLSGRATLLVLDHCGCQIDRAAACCAALLRGAPDLRIVAAGREPLQIHGEWIFRLDALALAPDGIRPTARQARAYPALSLFVELMSQQLGGYQLSDADAPLVALICRRLDGLPLALELAACMVGQVGLAALAAGVKDSLSLLTRGRRSADPRHQSMQRSMDWAYERLAPAEQRLLLGLARFGADFTAACCDARGEEGVARAELLCNLVQKCWVHADTSAAVVRYRLLNVTRLYLRARWHAVPAAVEAMPALQLAALPELAVLVTPPASGRETVPHGRLRGVGPKCDQAA